MAASASGDRIGDPLGGGGLDLALNAPTGFFLLSRRSLWISSIVRRSRLRVPSGIIDSVSDALNLAAARVEFTFIVFALAAMPCGRGADSDGPRALLAFVEPPPLRLPGPPTGAPSLTPFASPLTSSVPAPSSDSESDDDDDDDEPELEDDESSPALECASFSSASPRAFASCRVSAIRSRERLCRANKR